MRRVFLDRKRLVLAVPIFAGAIASCAVVPSVPQSHPVTRGPVPSRLPQSASSYARQPAAFRTFVNSINWVFGQQRERLACTSLSCDTPNTTTNLRIEAIPGVANFDPDDAGDFGTIIGRVRNEGSFRDFDFQASPGAEVYLVVHRWWSRELGHHVAQMEFVELARTPEGDRVRVVRPGQYRECLHHPPHGPGKPPAMFGGCEHPQVGAGSADVRGPNPSDLVAPLGHTGGGQFECPHGCCEVAPT